MNKKSIARMKVCLGLIVIIPLTVYAEKSMDTLKNEAEKNVVVASYCDKGKSLDTSSRPDTPAEDVSSDFIYKLLLVVIGTGFFGFFNNWLVHRRHRDDSRREKSLEFLDEVSSVINRPLTNFFRRLQRGSSALNDDDIEAVAKVFEMRLSVQVKSSAYLNEKSFFDFYFRVAKELDYIINSYNKLSPDDYQAISDDILVRCQKFAGDFDYSVSTDADEAEEHYKSLLLLVKTILRYSEYRLSETIKHVMDA